MMRMRSLSWVQTRLGPEPASSRSSLLTIHKFVPQGARVMKFHALLAIPLILIGPSAHSAAHGVAVQVNEGKKIPTVAQLKTVLAPGDLVRDVLGWHKVDRNCNLRTNPSLPIIIPSAMNTLYQNVSA